MSPMHGLLATSSRSEGSHLNLDIAEDLLQARLRVGPFPYWRHSQIEKIGFQSLIPPNKTILIFCEYSITWVIIYGIDIESAHGWNL
jgi:hypothetical protein